MTIHTAIVALAGVILTLVLAAEPASAGDDRPTGTLSPALERYLADRGREFDRISAERQAILAPLADWIAAQRGAETPIHLIFVCTHNSRRSHMSQLWARAAAVRHGIDLTTWSGGTESTAFNPRAVASMKRAGFKITRTTDNANPIYHVALGDGLPIQTCFSKPYAAAPNPTSEFAAVMVCSDADRRCPLVTGATGRFPIPFVDPKVSDGTPSEASTYDERSAQIAREMLWVMNRAAAAGG